MKLSLLLLSAAATIVSAGGFIRSCTVLSINDPPQNVIHNWKLLRAYCVRRDGSNLYNELNLDLVLANHDGYLRRGERGMYSRTCDQRTFKNDGQFYEGACRTRDKRMRYTSIDLNEFIGNNDGCLEGLGQRAECINWRIGFGK